MGTSSARPDDLDAFARDSRAADDELRTHAARLHAVYNEFQSGTQWGQFDAHSLIDAYGQYLDLNEMDARWVSQIAAAFRHAGGDGALARLPDAAIAASLRAAGLTNGRQSVTFDDPIAYGFPPTTGYADDPVNTASGNFLLAETDLHCHALALDRTYNSRSDQPGAFGPGWTSWADTRLRAVDDGAAYEGPDGQRALFPRQGSGYGRVLGITAEVVPTADGLELRWFDGRRWSFDTSGRPVTADRITFGYLDGRLASLTHTGGRSIELTWTADRITTAVASDGRRTEYTYLDGALVSTGDRRYEIQNARIVAVTDADGVTEARNTYDPDGRVLTQMSRFNRRTHFAYLPGAVTVTTGDEDNSPTNTYIHDPFGRLLAVIDGHGQRLSRTYDQWGNPVTTTDRDGGVTTVEWDERSCPVRRVLPDGSIWTYRYDESSRLIEVAAMTGASTTYSYPATGRLPEQIVDGEGGVTRLTVRDELVHEVTDPDGVTVAFGFDAEGALASTTDASGQTARIERDVVGRVIAAVTPLGRRSSYTYDERGRLVERRDSADGVWRYEYTPAGRLRMTVDPSGGRTEIRHGPHGEVVSTTDPLGAVTGRRYDEVGNVIRLITADHAEWAYEYDALSRLTAITDPMGETWLREYDVVGDLAATIDPVGARRSVAVDPGGRVTRIDDGMTTCEFEYDPLGRVVAQRRPNGAVARAGYDRCGRRLTVEDAGGGVTRLEYTPGGRLRRRISPGGRVTAFEYDETGRLAARIDGAGRRWEFRYDADSALVARTQPDGLVETFAYDAAGRLSARQAPGRTPVRYRYDEMGRLVEDTGATGATRRFIYDRADRLVEAIDPAGRRTRYRYDELGRSLSVVDPLGGTIERRYDAVGRTVAESDPLGRTASVEYDRAGRPVTRVDGAGLVSRLAYDRSGRVREIRADGAAPITIERDALGRPVEILEAGSFRHRLRWDPAGRLIERQRDGLTLRWRYGPDGERTAIGYPDGTETEYFHDDVGLVTALRHPAIGEVTVHRDGAGRMTGADSQDMRASWRYADGLLVGYEFAAGGRHRVADLIRDAAGRVTTATVDGIESQFGYDEAGQLVTDGERTLSYDEAGRLIRESSVASETSYTYDAAGELTSRDATTFSYDGAGRRMRETTPGGTARAYRWDGLGRLAGYSDDGQDTAVSVDALGELADVAGTPLLWDTTDGLGAPCWLGGHAVLGHGTPWATAGGGEVEWLLPDWLGTVGGTDDPWGGGARRVGPSIGFRGEIAFGSLTWLRNRVYDANTRGFLTPDPLLPVPGTPFSANPYHYAGNDPVGLADPLGLRPVTDEDLRKYRDQMSRDVWSKTTDWVGDNWEYIAAGALIVGGVLVMATGVGGPLGAAMIGGALLSAGGSAGIQKFTTGDVDWGQVAVAGLIGGAAGGLGAGGGLLVGSSGRVAAASPFLRGAVTGGVTNLVGGAANRGLNGDDIFDPAGMATDVLLGGVTGGVAGRVGARALTSNRPYQIGNLPPDQIGSTNAVGQITIRPGLSRLDFEETLRHETVHSILTPSRAGLSKITLGLYENSHLYRYAEEAAAETYGTLSLAKGLTFPFTSGGYELNPLRVAGEAAAVGTGLGAIGFGGYELAEGVFGDD
jgi:RHS repeat-associated protein